MRSDTSLSLDLSAYIYMCVVAVLRYFKGKEKGY